MSKRYLCFWTFVLVLAAAILPACAAPVVAPTSVPAAATVQPPAATSTTAPASAAPAATTAAPTTAAASSAPASSSSAQASKPAKPGGTLRLGTNQDAVGFDPHVTNATSSVRILENIYSGLLRFNEKLEVQPDLAETYTVDSPTQYTFKLRKGVKFHNGREMKAADVKYSIERIQDEKTASPRRANFAPVASIETPDDYTVVIKLKNPYAPLLSILADRTTAVVPKEVVEANGGKLDKVAVGTGPFKLKEYVPNTRTVLEKNPDYFIKGAPYLDSVIYQPVPDDTARSTAVRTGAVDMIEYAPAKDLTLLKADTKITMTGSGNNNVRYLSFNIQVKPFDNVKVRQAIAWAIDRQAVVDAAVSGAGTPLTAGPFLPSYWPGLQEPYYKQDLAKAKQLLTEAGFPNGFKAKLKNTPTYAFLGNAGIVVQEQLKAIGIDFEIIPLEWSIFLRDYQNKDYEACVSGYSAFVDPHPQLDSTYVTGRPLNIMNYSNPKFDELIAQAAVISDQSERAKLYRQAQLILLEDSPMVFLYSANEYEAMQSYVKGYVHYVNGSHLSFREVWLDK